MNLKTYEKGIYVRRCKKSEYSKPTRLGRIMNIAFSNKDEKSIYQIIYFKKNELSFSKFSSQVKLLSGQYFTGGELFEIVDNFNSNSSFFDREVIISDKTFEVKDNEEPYRGSFYFRKDELLNVSFYNENKEKTSSGIFRFIPNKSIL